MAEADILKDMLRELGATNDDAFRDEKAETAGGILQQLIDGYQDLSEEEQDEFRKTATKEVLSRFQDAVTTHVTRAYFSKVGVLAACVFVLLIIFVFFGYKLIKSIKDKEKKKEEKKKQKQSKKKK